MPQTVLDPVMDRVRNPRIYLLLAVALATLVVAVVSAAITLRSISEDTDRVEHTLAVEATINQMSSANERLETARRGFMLQPDREFITILRGAQEEFDAQLAALRDRTSDNSVQQRRVDQIARDNERRRKVVENNLMSPATSAALVRSGQLSKEEGTLLTRDIRKLAVEMAKTESELLTLRNRAQLDSLVLFYIVGGVALLLLLFILAAVIALILRNNRDLNRAQEELRVANAGLEAAVADRTAELTRANQEIQRFAYIVSHDLRSPLVNVLGFTSELEMARKDIRAFLEKLFAERPELRDNAVWAAVDEDLPEATGFIRTSTEKMDRLINSILDLSRQGRRRLTPELLDMTAIVTGIADTLHQRAEQAGAKVTVEPLPELVSDRVAVEQVLSNLMENALKYLSPARAGSVRVRGKTQGKRVIIEVIDNGRGIAPVDHERVFELFRRAGQQDQAGEGIGLANVRALAYRLGGTVELESQLDEGATFRVNLPAQLTISEDVQ